MNEILKQQNQNAQMTNTLTNFGQNNPQFVTIPTPLKKFEVTVCEPKYVDTRQNELARIVALKIRDLRERLSLENYSKWQYMATKPVCHKVKNINMSTFNHYISSKRPMNQSQIEWLQGLDIAQVAQVEFVGNDVAYSIIVQPHTKKFLTAMYYFSNVDGFTKDDLMTISAIYTYLPAEFIPLRLVSSSGGWVWYGLQNGVKVYQKVACEYWPSWICMNISGSDIPSMYVYQFIKNQLNGLHGEYTGTDGVVAPTPRPGTDVDIQKPYATYGVHLTSVQSPITPYPWSTLHQQMLTTDVNTASFLAEWGQVDLNLIVHTYAGISAHPVGYGTIWLRWSPNSDPESDGWDPPDELSSTTPSMTGYQETTYYPLATFGESVMGEGSDGNRILIKKIIPLPIRVGYYIGEGCPFWIGWTPNGWSVDEVSPQLLTINGAVSFTARTPVEVSGYHTLASASVPIDTKIISTGLDPVHISGVTETVIVDPIVIADQPLWVTEVKPRTVLPSGVRRKQDKDKHNKEMHAMNGNTTTYRPKKGDVIEGKALNEAIKRSGAQLKVVRTEKAMDFEKKQELKEVDKVLQTTDDDKNQETPILEDTVSNMLNGDIFLSTEERARLKKEIEEKEMKAWLEEHDYDQVDYSGDVGGEDQADHVKYIKNQALKLAIANGKLTEPPKVTLCPEDMPEDDAQTTYNKVNEHSKAEEKKPDDDDDNDDYDLDEDNGQEDMPKKKSKQRQYHVGRAMAIEGKRNYNNQNFRIERPQVQVIYKGFNTVTDLPPPEKSKSIPDDAIDDFDARTLQVKGHKADNDGLRVYARYLMDPSITTYAYDTICVELNKEGLSVELPVDPNRYAVLESIEKEDEKELNSAPQPSKRGGPKGFVGGAGTKGNPKGSKQQTGRSPADHMRALVHEFSRGTKKAFNSVVYTIKSEEFLRSVADDTWGVGWMVTLKRYTQLQGIVALRLQTKATHRTMTPLVVATSCYSYIKFKKNQGSKDEPEELIDQYFKFFPPYDRTPLDMGDEFSAIEQAMRNKILHALYGNIMSHKAWNKLMHALNGNLAFHETMKDIDALPGTESMYSGGENGTLEPGKMIMDILTTPPTINPILQNITSQFVITGRAQAANNTTLTASLPPPSATLFPRSYRTGLDNNPIPLPIRLHTTSLTPQPFRNVTLTDTEIANAYRTAAREAANNIGRPDQTTFGGFSGIDIASLSKLSTMNGLSVDMMAVKAAMMLSVLAWTAERQVLPMHDSGAVNTRLGWDNATQPVLRVNADDNGFGESCGGFVAPVFPFLGGSGSLYFHMSPATVPNSDKANVIFVPADFIYSDEDPDQQLALYISLFAPWPYCMFGLQIATTSGVSIGQATQYKLWQSLVSISGVRTIHIILPRSTTARNPQAEGEAEAIALLQPAAGPDDAGAIGQNDLLYINYTGQDALVGYNLTDYLVSWVRAFDVTSLTALLSKIASRIDLYKPLMRAWDLLGATVVRFPLMTNTSSAGFTGTYFPDNAAWYVTANSRSMESAATTVNWPQPLEPKGTLWIYDMDLLALNQVILGLRNAPNLFVDSDRLPAWCSSKQLMAWLHSSGIQQAAAFNSHYISVGWQSDTWTNASQDTTLKVIRSEIKDYFNGSAIQGVYERPKNSGLMNAYIKNTLGGSFARYDDGETTFCDYYQFPMTPFARTITTGIELSVYHIPVVLPDIWIHMVARKLPLSQVAFPPTGGSLGIQGYVPGMTQVYTAAGYGPFIDKSALKLYSDQEAPRFDSEHSRWNTRLLATFVSCGIYNLSGIDTGYPVTATKPAQRNGSNSAPYIATNAAYIFRVNTMSLACMQSNGAYIYPMTANAQGQTVWNAMKRIGVIAMDVWLMKGMNGASTIDVATGETNPFSKYKSNNNKTVPTSDLTVGQGKLGSITVVTETK